MNSAASRSLRLVSSFDKPTSTLPATSLQSGSDFLTLEQQALARGNLLADTLVAQRLQAVHEDLAFVDQAVREARNKSAVRLRHVGLRTVWVQLSGGGRVEVRTPYLVPDLRGRPGRRRGHGRRGEPGGGCYPVLAKLGICDRATPLLRSSVARSLVRCGSYEEAGEQLRQQGIDVDLKTLVGWALSIGEQACARRDELLAQALQKPVPADGPLAGKRVLVSVDGGRARVRTPHVHGRRRSNGRRGFHTNWREPKGLVIYVLDEQGRIERTFRPSYDATLSNADEVFTMLAGYLRLLGAKWASELVFVADGATWLWDRLPWLKQACELEGTDVVEVLDFYHACDYLSQAIEACRGLKACERGVLFDRLKGYIRKGQHAYLLVELRKLAKGKRHA